jgi:hypothetical protein
MMGDEYFKNAFRPLLPDVMQLQKRKELFKTQAFFDWPFMLGNLTRRQI